MGTYSTGLLIKKQIQQNKALRWAKSMNYEIPDRKKPNWKSYLLLVILFFAGIFPALFYLLLMLHRKAQFDRRMRPLVAKWEEAGSPED
tara:strand:+ start:510 stop:776 length:267 start_codon:yes stop_codon:yes gene_type:complete